MIGTKHFGIMVRDEAFKIKEVREKITQEI